jgi:hypothetical protein
MPQGENMFKRSIIVFVLFAILLTGCMSSRMGYPVKTVEIPTPVTLFCSIEKKAIFNWKIDPLSREAWKLFYGKKYEDIFAAINIAGLQDALSQTFREKASEMTDLFIVDPAPVSQVGLVEPETKADSGETARPHVNLDAYADSVATRYILILYIDQWGYTVTVTNKFDEEGPFISAGMQLYDKETGETVWKYKSLHQHHNTSIPDRSDIRTEGFQKIIEELVNEAVNRYFSGLASK